MNQRKKNLQARFVGHALQLIARGIVTALGIRRPWFTAAPEQMIQEGDGVTQVDPPVIVRVRGIDTREPPVTVKQDVENEYSVRDSDLVVNIDVAAAELRSAELVPKSGRRILRASRMSKVLT